MKKTWIVLGLLLIILVSCFWFRGSLGENENIGSFIWEIKKPGQYQTNSRSQGDNQLVEKMVYSLIIGDKSYEENYSEQLQSRVAAGEFTQLYEQIFQVEVVGYVNKSIEGVEKTILDVLIKREDGVQWLQLEALWEPENKKLYDVVYHQIDYLSRLNSNQSCDEAVDIAETILTNLKEPDKKLMGWRYKKTDLASQEGIEDINIISLKGMGSRINARGQYPEETAVKASYIINFFGRSHELESILYLKKYDNWQLEDIRILEVKVVSKS